MLLLDLPKKKVVERTIRKGEIFCVIEHAHKDREIADAVCSGTFTIAGSTLDLGSEINWLENPRPNDIEWQIEWHKFYYGLDMAHAFSLTGDAKFLRGWEKLVRSFIRQVPVDFASKDVLARRVQNWIYARQIIKGTNYFHSFSGDFESELFTSINAQIEFLRENLTSERNHRTLELYSLFIAALAMPQLDKSIETVRFAMTALSENLSTDIRADGVQREQSTHYHCTVLRSFLGAKENADRFGLKFSEQFDDRLVKACEYAMHFHRPDGQIPAFSDSDTGSYLDLLKLAGNIFSRPDFRYAATAGREGAPPTSSNVSFDESGYFIQRSGWGTGETSFTDERFLMFDCGPIGDGGHGHYDLLNVEIAACGQPLIVDSGRFTYAESTDINWRHYFKGTAAHNTVVVDKKDQTAYRRGKAKGDTALGEFIERVSLPNLDVLCGRAFSPNYEAVHSRRIFFIRNKYWLIADHLKGEIPHQYDLRFHLTPADWNRVNTFQTLKNTVVRTPYVALLFEKHRETTIEPSWFAPQYGIKHRAPCVSVMSDGAGTTDFYTLVMPICLKESLPSFTVKEVGVSTIIEILQGDVTEEILCWDLMDEKLENLSLGL